MKSSTIGPFQQTFPIFNGWTLPELAVLHKYRRRTAQLGLTGVNVTPSAPVRLDLPGEKGIEGGERSDLHVKTHLRQGRPR